MALCCPGGPRLPSVCWPTCARPPQALLPHLQLLPSGLVSTLANPADRAASTLLLGALVPCIGAPIYEEIQARAFNLQALPGIHAKAEANDEDPEVGAWRMIYPRAYLNNVAQQSMAFYEAFAEAQGIG
mgnify:CR=1 FL=1